MEPSLSQLRRGVLEFCVLSMLSAEPVYALDLVRRLADTAVLASSEGTIYPLLSRLRRDGWVQSTWVESGSGPPRRYYAVTEPGRHALHAFTSDWRRFRDTVDSLLPEGPP